MAARSPSKAAPIPGGRTGSRAAPRAGTVALVGRPNVGKSTLLNALLGERIAITSPHPQTTRDRIAGILTRGDAQFVFFDTPGLHRPRHRLGQRMNDLAEETAASCDVALFVTDIDPKGARAPAEVDRPILERIPTKTPTVLVVNKIDRVKPRSRLLPLLQELSSLREFAAVVPVAARTADGVERVLEALAPLLPEGEPLYGEDDLSDKPVRFFIAEFVREQVLAKTRQEVPHGVAVSVESFAESDAIVRISVTIHVAKGSHKGILIGDAGRMLASIGKAARLRAEEMLGKKVHLDTWVRVTEGWFDDPARLADLGYADEAPRKRTKSPARGQKKPPRGPSPRGPKP